MATGKLPKLGTAVYVDPKNKILPVALPQENIQKLGGHIADKIHEKLKEGATAVSSMAKTMAVDAAKKTLPVPTDSAMVDHLGDVKDLLTKFLAKQDDIKRALDKTKAPTVNFTLFGAGKKQASVKRKPKVKTNPQTGTTDVIDYLGGAEGPVDPEFMAPPPVKPVNVPSPGQPKPKPEKLEPPVSKDKEPVNELARQMHMDLGTIQKVLSIINTRLHTAQLEQEFKDTKFGQFIEKKLEKLKKDIKKEPPDYIGGLFHTLANFDEIPAKIGHVLSKGVSRTLNTMISFVLSNPVLSGIVTLLGTYVVRDITGALQGMGPLEGIADTLMSFFNAIIGKGYGNLFAGSALGAAAGAAIGSIGGPVGWLAGAIIGMTVAAISNAIFGSAVTGNAIRKITRGIDDLLDAIIDYVAELLGQTTQEVIARKRAAKNVQRKTEIDKQIEENTKDQKATEEKLKAAKEEVAKAPTGSDKKVLAEAKVAKIEKELAGIKSTGEDLAQQSAQYGVRTYKDYQIIQQEIDELEKAAADPNISTLPGAAAQFQLMIDRLKKLLPANPDSLVRKPKAAEFTSLPRAAGMTEKTAVLDYAGKKSVYNPTMAAIVAPQTQVNNSTSSVVNAPTSIMMMPRSHDEKMSLMGIGQK